MSEYIVELTDENHNRLMAECDGIHEEVVRCRDCRNGHQTPVRGFRCWHWMELDGNGDPVPVEVAPDGFCSQGKRRSE